MPLISDFTALSRLAPGCAHARNAKKGPGAVARVANGDPCDRPGGWFASLVIRRAGFARAGQHAPRQRHEGGLPHADPDARLEGAEAVRRCALTTNKDLEHRECHHRGRSACHGLVAGSLVEAAGGAALIAAAIPLGAGCGVGPEGCCRGCIL